MSIHKVIFLGARQGAAFIALFTVIFILPALAGMIAGV